MGVPEREKERKGQKEHLRKKMIEMLPDLMKHMDLPTDTRNTRNSKLKKLNENFTKIHDNQN